MEKYKIGNKNLEIPIIQGGMGIGVSLENLAGSVAREGAMGVISLINLGYKEEGFREDPMGANKLALAKKYRQAKEISQGRGLIAVNIMEVVNGYEEMVREAARIKVDAIIVGAGLPLNLPALVEDREILLGVIVSSKKALNLITRVWEKRYGRLPDFIILEGPKAGGHLGFREEDLVKGELDLEHISQEVIDYGRELGIEVFIAGGVFSGKDLKEYRERGAMGLQIGTRFIATWECDAHLNFKKMIVENTSQDLTIFQSPAGLPGRAIENKLLREVRKERKPVKNCSNCLRSCKPAEIRFCIREALTKAVEGNREEGLFFAGENIDRIDKILSVEEVIEEIVREWKE